MAHTLSHTMMLNCPAEDAWECCKHGDKVMPDLMPEHFTSCEFVEGNGGPGSVYILKFGPAIPQAGAVTERLDKVDDATKTLVYSVVEGDPRYANLSAEVHFESKGENQTEATWTAKYDPVGEVGPPEHLKQIGILVFQAFEKASKAKKTVSHTETLDASPDAIWAAHKQESTILPKALPHLFKSITYVQGSGEPGSIRVCKMGPAIPNEGEVVERCDVLDEANKKAGYTVVKGDPRFKHVSAVVQYAPGPTAGTTTATWNATYVPVEETGTLDNKFIVAVWKALEAEAKA